MFSVCPFLRFDMNFSFIVIMRMIVYSRIELEKGSKNQKWAPTESLSQPWEGLNNRGKHVCNVENVYKDKGIWQMVWDCALLLIIIVATARQQKPVASQKAAVFYHNKTEVDDDKELCLCSKEKRGRGGSTCKRSCVYFSALLLTYCIQKIA